MDKFGWMVAGAVILAAVALAVFVVKWGWTKWRADHPSVVEQFQERVEVFETRVAALEAAAKAKVEADVAAVVAKV